MGVGQIIDAAIKLYRSNWKTLVTLVAWPLVPFALIQALSLRSFRANLPGFNPATRLSAGQALSADFPAHYLIAFAAFLAFYYLVITPLLIATVSRASADIYLGRPLTVGQVYRAAIRKIPRILWTVTLILLIQFGVAAILIVPAVVLHQPLLGALGVLLAIVPLVFFWFRFILAPTAVMLEGTKATASLRRSWRLTSGSYWRTVGLWLLAWMISEAISAVFSIVGAVASFFAGSFGWIPSGLFSAAALVLVTPFSTIVLVLLYFDLRIRKEGFDLAILAQQLQTPAQLAQP